MIWRIRNCIIWSSVSARKLPTLCLGDRENASLCWDALVKKVVWLFYLPLSFFISLSCLKSAASPECFQSFSELGAHTTSSFLGISECELSGKLIVMRDHWDLQLPSFRQGLGITAGHIWGYRPKKFRNINRTFGARGKSQDLTQCWRSMMEIPHLYHSRLYHVCLLLLPSSKAPKAWNFGLKIKQPGLRHC